MTSTNNNRVILSFNSQLGEVVRFSIPRANMNKTAPAALAAMNAMIATEAIITTNGVPTSIHGAQLINTQRVQVA
jgi:hypothetical protein